MQLAAVPDAGMIDTVRDVLVKTGTRLTLRQFLLISGDLRECQMA